MFGSDVDLTKDRVFDKNVREIQSVSISVREEISQPGMVFTGTGQYIEDKIKALSFCDGKTCDRCGKDISPFSSDTLCDECVEIMRRDALYKELFHEEVETPWFLTP